MNSFRLRITDPNGKVIEFHGPTDITEERTEAIVNAANSYLIGGGGVDGAIHDAGGPSILQECKLYVAANGQLPAGRAMRTGGGNLAAKHVIHTVGPVYRGGDNGEAELLAGCYRESIRLADEYTIQSMAFPAISTGAYGYPVNDAAKVAVHAVLENLSSAQHVIQVRFVLFDIAAVKAYVRAGESLQRTHDPSEYRIERADS